MLANRENPMSVRSKNALSEALLRLMMAKPFDAISISDITARAGLSRQTFYTNFARREDIIIYMLDGLFKKYAAGLEGGELLACDLMVGYFVFWDGNREFLKLLYSRRLGYLFEERNRAFFTEGTDALDPLLPEERWQHPYIKAGVAGLTCELLRMWITDGLGLSVNVMTLLAENFLTGKVFADT